jgi:hypothetical protein
MQGLVYCLDLGLDLIQFGETLLLALHDDLLPIYNLPQHHRRRRRIFCLLRLPRLAIKGERQIRLLDDVLETIGEVAQFIHIGLVPDEAHNESFGGKLPAHVDDALQDLLQLHKGAARIERSLRARWQTAKLCGNAC